MVFMKSKNMLILKSILYIFLSFGGIYHVLSNFSDYFHDPSFKDLFAAFVVVPLLGYAGISDLVKTIRLWKNDN